eukprot:scpid33635/ scgid5600/ E3 ubiquitin-protein ligase NRDP1; RING finger protein 41 &gt; E3 ubiquitin-protein ligase NRDP1; RING finger protein 41
MATHLQALTLLCRVGGVRLTKCKQTTLYSVRENADGLKKAFGIDVSQDKPDIHPTRFCSTCNKTVNRALSSDKYNRCGGGCASPVEWLPHDAESQCKTCSRVEKIKIGGRPAKKKRTTVPPVRSQPDTQCTSSTQPTQSSQISPAASGIQSNTSSTSSTMVPTPAEKQLRPASISATNESLQGQDIAKSELISRATPSYKTERELSPDRFIMNFSELICSICKHILDKSVQASCCGKNFCVDCIWHWLVMHASCPVCRSPLQASQLLTPSLTLKNCLAEVLVRCDNYLDSFNGCSVHIPLASLQHHGQTCTNTGKHTITPTTPVGDILHASPKKLQGNVAEKLTSHLVRSKSDNGLLHLRSQGPSQIWKKTTVGTVSSDEASERTQRRRSLELRQTEQLVCGSSASSIQAQQAATIRRMPEEERRALLIAAGVLPRSIEKGSTLAMKADLHMPWFQLRKLKVWLKDYGLHLESEGTMRQQLNEHLKVNIVAEDVPFVIGKTAEIEMRPMVALPDLVGTVHGYLDQLDSTEQLFWHAGVIPEDQIWVKVGGDHGGDSFKMSVQVCNVRHPNSIRNIIPFVVFAAKDSPANLATALQPFASQINLLSSTLWHGRSVRVLLFGDYEFQTQQYGLSGSSAVHPCLHCEATKTEFQQPGATSNCRSLASLETCHSAFVAAGARLPDAKRFKNCIRPVILPIPIEDAIIPVLHLDLGIFKWIFEALVKDCQTLDMSLAASGPATPADSQQFSTIVAKHQKLREKQDELIAVNASAQQLRNQLDWLALHSNTLLPAQIQAAAGVIQVQCAQQAASRSSLEEETSSLVEEIQRITGTISGPCEQSLDKVLQRNNICRQRYHGGSFIGNHVHHALQSTVIEQLASAPLAVIQEDGRTASASVLSDATDVCSRYMALMEQFAACRRRYSSCKKMTPEDLAAFKSDVRTFMGTARAEIVRRKLGHITPKLHLLEAHVPASMDTFGVGLGLLAEQGGESIHAEFNS